MKKFKALLLGMLMVLCLGVLTACGVKEPTEDDVKEALEDKEYLPGSKKGEDKKDVDYEISVDKVRMSDDKDEARVTCTLVVKEGSVETSTEYKIKFKLRDDKSWKVKEVEAGDAETKLVSGITDDDIKELVKSIYVYVDNASIDFDDETTTFKIGDHDTDLEGMKDTVTLECTGEEGFSKYSFDLEVEFYYSTYDNKWYVNNKKVENIETSYADGYEVEFTKEDIAADLKNVTQTLPVMGEYYEFTDENATIEVTKIGETEYDNYYSYTTVTIKYTISDVVMEVELELEYYYDDDGWEFQWIEKGTVLSFDSDIIGTYKGTDGDKNITIVIKNEFYKEDSRNLAAEVTVTTNGITYSYSAYVSNYEPSDEGYISIAGYEWITEPSDASYYKESYTGSFANGAITPRYSWDKWSFTKQQ